jgi:hypothetical protein
MGRYGHSRPTQHAQPGNRVKSGNWLATTGQPPKPLKRVFESHDNRVSMLSDAGFVYLMTDSECHVLNPSSGDLRLLCKERKPKSEPEPEVGAFRFARLFRKIFVDPFPPGRFWELERGEDSLRILVGADPESAQWVEIDKQTGAFLREVPK